MTSDDADLFESEYRRRLFTWAAERVRGRFTETTWRAFWLTGVEGQEIASVAETLGLTPGAAYIARSRVMALLRREIDQVEGIA
jgi:RNA polymerase sigma-70 factor (ECF subfamily)